MTRQHHCQVVAVSDVDDHNNVKVAMVSHNHPQGVPTKPAREYADFHHADSTRGESFMDVGRPKTVHVSKLDHPVAGRRNLAPDKLQLLMSHIGTCVLELL